MSVYSAVVRDCESQTIPDRPTTFLNGDAITSHTLYRNNTFLGETSRSLDQEQPSPPGKPAYTIESGKDTSGYKTLKGGGKNESRVENGGAKGKLFARIPAGEKVEDTREEGRFGDTKKEADDDKMGVVLCSSGCC
ncbi:hypothetical protein VE03_04683 [Pseudogymnoascus sp. 23342-1-I1]|nr:hypothetical protein VE03_04683 [Pseudogymnoascus sp. 23342-1-I1]